MSLAAKTQNQKRPSSTGAMVASSSRPLSLQMRADLTTNRQSYQGRDYWVVKDPIGLKYYRFEEEEFALLNLLDGSVSADQVKRQFDYRFAPQKISLQELYQFIGMLYRSNLLISKSPNQGVELKIRGEKNRNRQFKQSLSNVLAVRFKGFDPDRILTMINHWTSWFFSWPAFVCFLILGISACGLLISQFETFQAKLPGFQDFFAAKNWIWLALVMGLTKVVHEFGHGLACKRFGGECHEMGVMLLVMTPCLYCDVSDSWLLPNKWKRAMIAAAGMYVELVMAAIAVFVWWFSQPGMVNQLALNVIFVSSVSTILFNANPLLRYDGYYILSDIIEIPNLRSKASSILSRTFSQLCLGIEAKPDPFLPASNRWLFGLYSIAAALYRWLITFSIFWFIYQLLEPYGLKIIGQMIAMTAIWGLLGSPLVRAFQFISTPGRMSQVKPAYVFGSTALAIALVIGILLIPIPHHVYCSFHVQHYQAENVYVDIPGTLEEIHVQANQPVHKGQKILSLKSSDLTGMISALHSGYREAESQFRFVKTAANRDPELANEIDGALLQLRSATVKLQQREKDLERLEICAPIEGLLLAPPRVEPPKNESGQLLGQLSNWHGTPLENRNMGAHLQQKTLVAQIVPDPGRLEAVLAIDQSDIEFIRQQQPVELFVNQLPVDVFESETVDISPTKMKFVPKNLSSRSGGDLIAIADSQGRDVPQSTTYQVSVPFDDPDLIVLTGSTGKAKIRTGSQTVGRRLWRLACKTFQFDL